MKHVNDVSLKAGLATKSAVLLIAAMFCAMPAWAQSGKITGTVVEAGTNDPLPGVNVSIEGTTRGTTTDTNGEYVIIGVRPGTYTVVASFVGFTTQRQEGVRVSLDLTTTIDFTLREEVVEGEEVVVTADAIRVRRDLTSSEARITAEAIENLPVQEVGDILSAQAGITTSGSGIHIRGGRTSEIAYFVDGVRVSDAYDGSISVTVENQGIEELQIISGTFNAEYGQAMSGIINVVTREGGNKFGGNLEVFTGGYVSEKGTGGADFLLGRNPSDNTAGGVQYGQSSPFGYLEFSPTHYQNYQGSLFGPILRDRLTFYGSARYFRNEGWFYGARLYNQDGTWGDSSLVAMNDFQKLSGQGNIKLRLSNNMTLNLIGLWSTSRGQQFDHAWRWAPDGRPSDYNDGYNLNLKFTHTLGARTFYTINLANYFSGYQRYLYENPLDDRYNGFLINPPDTVETGGQRFLRGGTDLGHTDRTSNAYLVKADVTSQLHRYHLVKAGVEARVDRLRFEGYGLRNGSDEGFTPAIPGRETIDFGFFEEAPFSLSAFIQDKMEYENFIVNAGLRFDYFDPRAQVPADPEDPNIFSPFKDLNRYHDLNGDGLIDDAERNPDNMMTVADREAYWWTPAETKYQISPRLGVAYPVTSESIIHFSYGHFLQIPTFNRLFDNSEYKLSINTGLYGPFGNPNLKAERTVMYEIGLQQGIGAFVVDVTGFYRDVRNWVSTSTVIESRSPGVSYVVFANRDYSNVRGVTLKLNRRFSGFYGMDVNYTFQVAEGSNSQPDAEFFARQNNEQPTIALLPLDWDQRHTASAAIYASYKGWGGSALTRYGSGYPYTPVFNQAETRGQNVSSNFPQNSRRKPATFTTDLYLYRDFALGFSRPRVFIQVYNLFDFGNPHTVYGDTGQPDVTLEQQRIGNFDPGWFVRPDFYSEPRRIHAGISLNF